ncbi:hypothetical protein ADL00_25450 [Streptomyces sp. AS58]|uniref:hypothetical protein n=1 Tax=Streptomyces sp. AS58 TaxID=1519489 RepID=UPI0006AF34CD|nr:hypothetical protein [Streptomyces sp. AS58]KOV59956.1 hypothetical protein ADL00_25450 [Streptomyces sp. AS58]
MTDPQGIHVPAFGLMVPSEGAVDATFRQIVQTDADSPLRPVEVEPFITERRGRGLRSARCWENANGRLMATVRFAWRLEADGVDLCLYMVWLDLGKMALHADTVDDFARTLWVSDTN